MNLKTFVAVTGVEDVDYDRWGWSMVLLFDVASVLDSADVAGDLSSAAFARWDYHRSPMVTVPSVETLAYGSDEDTEYGRPVIAEALLAGKISVVDLIHIGDVLSRYADLLRANGSNY